MYFQDQIYFLLELKFRQLVWDNLLLNNLFCRFPGVNSSVNILTLLKLFLSKDPNTTITVQTALFGGYATCEKDLILERIGKNEIACDEGYTFDPVSTRCYIVPDIISNDFIEGCIHASGSDFVQFDSDEEVGGFMDMLTSGKTLKNLYL
jgi:hypothetical protein